MATLLPNPKPYSFHSITDSRNLLLPYSFSRLALSVNCVKPVWASTTSSRRRREYGISFVSRWPSQTVSTSASIVSDEENEDWDDEEKEEEEEEGEEFMPLREMTRWLQNKPAGFGEGKRYDTTVEDKLLEEIKRNQKDRLEENSKPRASEKEDAGSVKKQEKQKVTDVIKIDHEVRVWNLPKKKNIDRDLWKAFKGFPGIISINPAVTGNRKTRDPICRGFAYIGFESDDAAYRFVQKYSKQNLLFGKAQKQISCDVINVHGVLNSPESSKSSSSTNMSDRRHSGDEVSMSYDISKSTTGMEPNKEEFSVLPNDRNISSSNNEAAVMAFEQSSLSCSGFVEGENEVNEDLQSNTPMLSYQNRKKIAKRDKAKPPKSSKAHILGPSAKLKIKDRAVLTGVLSKYGEVASAASKEI